MPKEENIKKSIVNKVLTSNIVVSIALMIIIGLVLLAATLYGLSSYTKHNESITVPSTKGLPVDVARQTLAAAGLKCEISDSIYTAESKPGSVLEQVPIATSSVKKGRTVFLTIQATAAQMVPVPQLKDFSQRQAIAQLNSLGFTQVKVVAVPSQYKGLVVRVTFRGDSIPAGQKVPKGSPLQLIVGAGGQAPVNTDAETVAPSNVAIDESFFE